MPWLVGVHLVCGAIYKRMEVEYMNKWGLILGILLFGVLGVSSGAMATNGDNMIGIGPIARAMGGVGVAAPQDAITAVFANPATLGAGVFTKGSSFDFAGDLFMPSVSGEVRLSGQTYESDSHGSVFSIPAIGLSSPVGSGMTFGIAAYGASGLGVDYRGTELDNPTAFGTYPLIQGEFTQLQIMKFAPSIGYKIDDALSVGASAQIDYATLDMRYGSSPGYAFGLNLGLLYKPMENLSVGLSYITPQSVKHKRVLVDMNGDNRDLKLEAPQQVNMGIALASKDIMNLLVEADVRWVGWANADGYKDFDWNNQWVYSLGMQIEPVSNFFLRAGYTYAENPVENHDGFDGSINFITMQPNSTKNVQGIIFPTYYYETFRMIGFPAIVEQHVTLGAGYRFNKRFSMNVGYTHALEKSMSETGTDLMGQPVTLESTLSEDSIDFGMTWNF